MRGLSAPSTRKRGLTAFCRCCVIARQVHGSRIGPPSRYLVGAALLLFPSAVLAQLQSSVVSGRVLDPGGAPAASAQVALMDPLGQAIGTAVADAEGRFRIRSVAPGVYHLARAGSTAALPDASGDRARRAAGRGRAAALAPAQRERGRGLGHERLRRRFGYDARRRDGTAVRHAAARKRAADRGRGDAGLDLRRQRADSLPRRGRRPAVRARRHSRLRASRRAVRRGLRSAHAGLRARPLGLRSSRVRAALRRRNRCPLAGRGDRRLARLRRGRSAAASGLRRSPAWCRGRWDRTPRSA